MKIIAKFVLPALLVAGCKPPAGSNASDVPMTAYAPTADAMGVDCAKPGLNGAPTQPEQQQAPMDPALINNPAMPAANHPQPAEAYSNPNPYSDPNQGYGGYYEGDAGASTAFGLAGEQTIAFKNCTRGILYFQPAFDGKLGRPQQMLPNEIYPNAGNFCAGQLDVYYRDSITPENSDPQPQLRGQFPFARGATCLVVTAGADGAIVANPGDCNKGPCR